MHCTVQYNITVAFLSPFKLSSAGYWSDNFHYWYPKRDEFSNMLYKVKWDKKNYLSVYDEKHQTWKQTNIIYTERTGC